MKTENWGDTATSPGTPKVADKRREPGRGGDGVPVAVREGAPGPQSCEATHFCCLKPQFMGLLR